MMFTVRCNIVSNKNNVINYFSFRSETFQETQIKQTYLLFRSACSLSCRISQTSPLHKVPCGHLNSKGQDDAGWLVLGVFHQWVLHSSLESLINQHKIFTGQGKSKVDMNKDQSYLTF